ncbi:hypothetical protein BDDG_08458 [Blastomyces dermatitidis ATCC 18188]|uniref:Multiple myeloma tumor-associated protein 2-like N-terminal domain-containing protein n=2 Tax=Ajellomyces dermatitidis TaxID=5039 RepID=F2TQK0_AJEDA|nr:hypothetical protein BDDG_08458 [Blastomyces dermatitidis ATCC 18188]EQL34325.1 hypothetical protein BDFG_03846 [Blastomyces dermatitidis ATCC 26199]
MATPHHDFWSRIAFPYRNDFEVEQSVRLSTKSHDSRGDQLQLKQSLKLDTDTPIYTHLQPPVIMDLVASIRKEGSRGGRDSFKWSDVKTSTHRENYLGHSLMAPVGRWQQNRDLSWYAKGDNDPEDSPEEAAAKRRTEREEEIKRIKEAEQEALARALGLPVAPKSSQNANMTPLGGKEVERAIQEASAADGGAENDDRPRGVGFGGFGGFGGMGGMKAGDQEDMMEGTGYEMVGPDNGMERRGRRGDRTRSGRDGGGDRRRRGASRDPDRGERDRRSRRHEKDDERHGRRRRRSRSPDSDHGVVQRRRSISAEMRRHRSRSGDRASYTRYRRSSRSRSRDRRRGRMREEKYPRRERSYSPAERRSHHDQRSRRKNDYDRRR